MYVCIYTYLAAYSSVWSISLIGRPAIYRYSYSSPISLVRGPRGQVAESTRQRDSFQNVGMYTYEAPLPSLPPPPLVQSVLTL